jgi:tetratricopeptide (TPR) repeat protein
MFIVNFTKSTQIYAKLADSLDTIEALSDMADVYQHFSRISLSLAVMNNSSSLVSLCQNAIEWELEAREEIVFKTGREEILTYEALGTEGKDPKEIIKNYWLFSKGAKNEALQAEITWDMVLKSGFGERKQRYYLAECYYRHAQFLFMEQKYEKAHEQIGKCQMINEQLIETSEIPEAYRNLSESHQLLCEIFLSQNHVAKSKKHVKEAIKLRKHLVNLTETIESAYLLADSYFLLGKIEKKVHLLKEAHAIITSIITQRPNVTLYAKELQEIEAELESIKREKKQKKSFFPFFSK